MDFEACRRPSEPLNQCFALKLHGITAGAAFLLSDGSGYINGDCITIDGGEWLKGAGQFNFVGDMMSDADWQALKPKKG